MDKIYKSGERHLGALLQTAAARWPQEEALVFNGQRVTWAAYNTSVDRLAQAFLEMGIQRGDRIGVMSTTRPEYIYTYLAAVRIGAILVGFNVSYTTREVSYLLELTHPVLMVMLDRIGHQLKPLIDQFPFVRRLIAVGDDIPAGAIPFDRLIGERRPEQKVLAARAAELDENDGALIVVTGGSTGLPKGALLTHASIIANVRTQVNYLDFRREDRLLLHLPLNHVSGATILVIASIMTGATLVLMERFHPELALETIQLERITVLGQVPAMYIMEFGVSNYADFDLSSLREVIVAGAPTTPAVMARIIKMAPVAFHGYGLTEVGGFVTFTGPQDDAATVTNTVGRAGAGVDLCIVDEERRPLPLGQVGEVAIRGRCLMKEYFNNPEETAAAIDETGWFYSGDLGWLDERGYLHLAGLKKDMYLTGGFNVYPPEIEAYVGEHPAVAQVACVGAEDETLGQVGALYVVAKPGNNLTVAELRSYCKRGLARYKVPRIIEICAGLPLLADGRVDKVLLAANY